jgi:hypothetical protein
MGMKLVNFKVDADVWERVKRSAGAEGRSASEVVRALLGEWLDRPGRPITTRPIRPEPAVAAPRAGNAVADVTEDVEPRWKTNARNRNKGA